MSIPTQRYDLPHQVALSDKRGFESTSNKKSVISPSQNGYMLRTGMEDKQRLDAQSILTESLLESCFAKWQARGLLGNDYDGQVLLDFGCGTGSAVHFLKKSFPNIVYQGIDNAVDSINCCKTVFPQCDFFIGDENSEQTKHLLARADIVFIRFVIQHQKDPVNFLRNLTDQMKPNAKLIIFEPYSDPQSINSDHPPGLYNALESRFKYKFALGEKAGNQQNFAPQIKEQLEACRLVNITEEPKITLRLPLSSLRKVIIEGFESIKAKLVEYNIATESEITHHQQSLETADDQELIYLGDTYILFAEKNS